MDKYYEEAMAQTASTREREKDENGGISAIPSFISNYGNDKEAEKKDNLKYAQMEQHAGVIAPKEVEKVEAKPTYDEVYKKAGEDVMRAEMYKSGASVFNFDEMMKANAKAVNMETLSKAKRIADIEASDVDVMDIENTMQRIFANTNKNEKIEVDDIIGSLRYKDEQGHTYFGFGGKRLYSEDIARDIVNNYVDDRNFWLDMKDKEFREEWSIKTHGVPYDDYIKSRVNEKLAPQWGKVMEAANKYYESTSSEEDEKIRRRMSSLDDGAPIMDEGDGIAADIARLRAATNAFEDATFFKGAAAGSVDALRTLSMDFSGIVNTAEQIRALNKFIRGEELNEKENLLVEMFEYEQLLNEEKQRFRGGINAADIGSGVVNSLAFSASFGIETMALGTGIAGRVAKDAVVNGFKQSAKEGFKAVGSALKWGAAHEASRTPLTLLPYQLYAEERKAQFQSTPLGIIKQESNPVADMWKAYSGAFLERYSERWGDIIDDGVKVVGINVARAKWLNRKFDGKPSEILEKLKAYRAIGAMDEARRNMHLAGLIGEYTSERLNEYFAPLMSGEFFATINEDGWMPACNRHYADIFTKESALTTFAICGASAAGGYTMRGVGGAMTGIEVSKLRKENKAMLEGISNEDVRNTLYRAITTNHADGRYEELPRLDWNGVSTEDAEKALKVVFNSAKVDALRGEAMETERLNAFAPELEFTIATAYRGVDMANPAPTMEQIRAYAKNEKGEDVYIGNVIFGDVENPQGVVQVARFTDGNVVNMNVEGVQFVRTSISSHIAEQYALMFGKSISKERLTEIMENVRNYDGMSEESKTKVLEENGFSVHKKGDVVTLADGRTAVIGSNASNGYYIAETTDAEGKKQTVLVGFESILNENDANMVQAQIEAQAEGSIAAPKILPATKDGKVSLDQINDSAVLAQVLPSRVGGVQAAIALIDSEIQRLMTEQGKHSATAMGMDEMVEARENAERSMSRIATLQETKNILAPKEQEETEREKNAVAERESRQAEMDAMSTFDFSRNYRNRIENTRIARGALSRFISNINTGLEALSVEAEAIDAEIAKVEAEIGSAFESATSEADIERITEQTKDLQTDLDLLNEQKRENEARRKRLEHRKAQYKQTLKDMGYTENEAEQRTSAGQDTALQELVAKASDALGMTIELGEEADFENDKIQAKHIASTDGKGRILINPRAKIGVQMAGVLSHEISHEFKQAFTPEEWAQFEDAVMTARFGKDWANSEAYKKEIESILKLHEDNNKQISNEKAQEEAVAYALEWVIFKGKDGVQRFEAIINQYSWSEKAINALRNLWDKVREFFVGISEQDEAMRNAVAEFDALFKRYAESKKFNEVDAESQRAVENANADGEVSASIALEEVISEKSLRYHQTHNTNVSATTLVRSNDAIQAMVDIMRPYLDVEMYGKKVLPAEVYGKGMSTIFKNQSYGASMENTTICLRTLAYLEFVDDVKEKLGRPLTAEESFLASQMLYDIAVDPQCLYCYVSLDRKAYDESLLSYLNQRDSVFAMYDAIEGKKTKKAIEEVYQTFLGGRKGTKQMRNRFNMWINAKKKDAQLITAQDLRNRASIEAIEQGEDANLKAQIKDAQKYAQSASWAKKVEDYRAYTGELLKMSDKLYSRLNNAYGLRFYSFSEYSPAFIVENMQMFRDAALKGLRGLAYTKEIEFAKIFAPTGANINISIFGRRNAEGDMVADTRQGANWDEARALRDQHDGVGIVFVATNDADVEWAMAQDFIDVVIPFHIVRTGSNIADFYEWTNYKNEQEDKGGKSILPNEHNNDKETFLRLAEERGLTPRFSKWVDNPNYMKLVNETRRASKDTPYLQPIFNLEEAKASFKAFVDKGGYFGGWYNVDEQGYQDGVEQVYQDVLSGKTAKDVSYGRQDVPADAVNTSRKVREHNNIVLLSSNSLQKQIGGNNEVVTSADAAEESFSINRDNTLAGKVGEILNEYDTEGVQYRTPMDIADAVETLINEYDGNESTTTLENILADYRAAQADSRNWGDRMEAGGDEAFEQALRLFAQPKQESFSISRNNEATIDKWLGKREDFTEETKTAFKEYIADYKPATQLATTKWFANGVIRIPEDMPKVEQAMEIAQRKKVDALQYTSPMELIEQFGVVTPKENLINPDDVPTLSNKTQVPNTDITIYDVDDSEESRKNFRELMNSHLGKESSPWCLLQANKNGVLTKESARYWKHYNRYPKRAAFSNGKLVAFFASDGAPTWWDRMDKPHSEIPVVGKIKGDALGRTATMLVSENGEVVGYSAIHKGDKKNGLYEEWYNLEQLHRRGTFKNGQPNGIFEQWHSNGVRQSYVEFENDIRINSTQWDVNGNPEVIERSAENGYKGFRISFKRNSNDPSVVNIYNMSDLEYANIRWGREGRCHLMEIQKGDAKEWFNFGETGAIKTYAERNGKAEKKYTWRGDFVEAEVDLNMFNISKYYQGDETIARFKDSSSYMRYISGSTVQDSFKDIVIADKTYRVEIEHYDGGKGNNVTIYETTNIKESGKWQNTMIAVSENADGWDNISATISPKEVRRIRLEVSNRIAGISSAEAYVAKDVAKQRVRMEQMSEIYDASNVPMFENVEDSMEFLHSSVSDMAFSTNDSFSIDRSTYLEGIKDEFDKMWAGEKMDRVDASIKENNPTRIGNLITAYEKYIKKEQRSAKRAKKETDRNASLATIKVYETIVKYARDNMQTFFPEYVAQGHADNIKSGKATLSQIESLFSKYNQNEEMAELFGVVMEASKQFGTKVAFRTIADGSRRGWQQANFIVYDVDAMNSDTISDEAKASTLLHELIHAVTSSAIQLVNDSFLRTRTGVNPSTKLNGAVRRLNKVFQSIRTDKAFKGEYGTKDVYEMVAELSNPQFVEKLKAHDIWTRIVDGIRDIILSVASIVTGKDYKTNAYSELRETLVDVIDATPLLYIGAINIIRDRSIAKNYLEGMTDAEVINLAEIEGTVNYSVVRDEAKIAELEASPKRIGYRNVILNEDGTFSSPMATHIGNTGKGKVKSATFTLGEWEEAEENPQLVDEQGKVYIYKDNGGSVKVAYDPYIHNRLDKVNAQFKEAWKRPNLVYVETEVPITDLESGYHADKAKLPVGVHSWSNGDLMLSRYDKPIRIVGWEEVADDWVARFKDRGVEFDIVPPALLPILKERGVEILPPHKGLGADATEAYEASRTEQESFSILQEEDTDTIFATAKEEFASTNDWIKTGWLMPDGTQLDFAEGGDYRGTDHRAIGAAYKGKAEHQWQYLQDFESRGGIRIHMNRDGKYGTIEMTIKPTAEQKKKLRSFIGAVGGNVDVDFMDENYNTAHSASYEGVSPARVLSGITNFYDEGIKPKGNVSYSVERERADIERVAKADGTWLKAPNGKDTNLSPEQWVTVRTKAFKAWFGDWENDPENASKVVDENGEPKQVYHSTEKEFYAFDKNKIGTANDIGFYGRGFYFTDNKEYSKTYGDNTLAVFLNVRTPFIANTMESSLASILFNREDDTFDGYVDDEIAEIYRDNIDRADGVIHNGPAYFRGGEYIFEVVVKEPNQIKSATENIGTFDSANDDIRYSIKRDDVGAEANGSEQGGTLPITEELEQEANEELSKEAQQRLELEEAQNTIDRMVRKLNAVAERKEMTFDEVKAFLLDSDTMSGLQEATAGQYRRIIRNVLNVLEKTPDKRIKVESLVDRIQRELLSARLNIANSNLKAVSKDFKRLVTKKRDGRNTRGEAVAKYVDNTTRQIVEEFIKAIAYAHAYSKGSDTNVTEWDNILLAGRIFTENTTTIDQVMAALREDLVEEYDEIKDGALSLLEAYKVLRDCAVDVQETRTKQDGVNRDIREVTAEMEELRGLLNAFHSGEKGFGEALRTLREMGYRTIPKAESRVEELENRLKELRKEMHSYKNEEANDKSRLVEAVKDMNTAIHSVDKEGRVALKEEVAKKKEAQGLFKKGIFRSIRNPLYRNVLTTKQYDKLSWAERRDLRRRGDAFWSDATDTFEFISRKMDRMSIPNEWLHDGWYYQFIMHPTEGVIARSDWRYHTEKMLRDITNEKAREIFAPKKKKGKFTISDLKELVKQKSGITETIIESKINGEPKQGAAADRVELTVGQLLYIRAMVKQEGGINGYLTLGLKAEQIENIVEYVEEKFPQFCEFDDWVRGEEGVLEQIYALRNPIYRRINGRNLDHTEGYFPIQRKKGTTPDEKAKVGEAIDMGTIAGGIGSNKKRVRNSNPMDIEVDYFEKLDRHITESLQWCAEAELIEKMNTLLVSPNFKRILEAQGVNKEILKNAFLRALGERLGGEDRSSSDLDRFVISASKHAVAANVALNLNSAAKQLVSITAALSQEVSPRLLANFAKNFLLPTFVRSAYIKSEAKMREWVGNNEASASEAINLPAIKGCWKWAMANMPTFAARADRGTMGYEIFDQEGMDKWDDLASKITSFGLSANVFIDLMTCAVVGKTLYDTRYAENIERKMSEEDAHNDARMRAAILVNQTQQSSEGAFLSKYQADRYVGLAAVLKASTVAYNNSQMSFDRNARAAYINLATMIYDLTNKKGAYDTIVEYKTEEYESRGFDKEEATKLAKRDYRRSVFIQLNTLFHNMVVNQVAWSLGAYMSTIVSSIIANSMAALFGFGGGHDDEATGVVWADIREEIGEMLKKSWRYTIPFTSSPIVKGVSDVIFSEAIGFNTASHSVVSQPLWDMYSYMRPLLDEDVNDKEKQGAWINTALAAVDAASRYGLGFSSRTLLRMGSGLVGYAMDGEAEHLMNFFSSPRYLAKEFAGRPRKGESMNDYAERVALIQKIINGRNKCEDVNKLRKQYADRMDAIMFYDTDFDYKEFKEDSKAMRRRVRNLAYNSSYELKEFEEAPSAEEAWNQMWLLSQNEVASDMNSALNDMLVWDEEGEKNRKEMYQISKKFTNAFNEVYEIRDANSAFERIKEILPEQMTLAKKREYVDERGRQTRSDKTIAREVSMEIKKLLGYRENFIKDINKQKQNE